MTGWVYKEVARLKIGIFCERSQTVKTEEDSSQLMMKGCMLRCTNVRYCKGFLGIIAIPRHLNSTWFIVMLNTELGFIDHCDS